MRDPVLDPADRGQRRHALYLRQKETLAVLLAHGAITQAQHDRSLRDLTEKMGEAEEARER